MKWLEIIKGKIPDFAKDIKLNLDAVALRSSLDPTVTMGCIVASAYATGNHKLLSAIINNTDFNDTELNAAVAAAAIMAMNNVWYPYVEMTEDPNLKGLPAQLRMTVIGTHGGVSKANFEAYSLAASIVGKCHFCVKSHYELLKKEGFSVEQLRDIGRIAAVVNAVSKCVAD